MKREKRLLSLLSVSIIALIVVSCSKPDKPTTDPTTPSTPTNPSALRNLTEFTFKASSNSGISRDIKAVIKDSTVLVTLPESLGSLNSLIADFTLSKDAHMEIGGKVIESGVTPINASKPVRLEAVAQNGRKSYYWLLARQGNSTYDSYIYDLMKTYAIPGCSFAISKDEEIIYAAGYGWAETKSHTLVTENSLFRLASVSKAQTALCIMRLYEAGKLTMSDKVFGEEGIFKDEFPETTEKPYKDQRVKDITVENLMFHNAGWNVEAIFDVYGTAYNLPTLDQRIDYLVHNQELKYNVGTTYSYSNISYAILGRIIEKLTGKTFEEYLRETVALAGVTDMWLGKTNREDKRENEVVYYPQNGSTGYQNNMEIVGACGAIIASAKDVVKIICAEDYGTKVPDILQPSTLDLLYTASPNYVFYAHGWRVNHTIYTGWRACHGGNLAGTATFMVQGKNGVNAVVLCNSRSYGTTDSNGADIDNHFYAMMGNIINLVK